MENHDLKDLIVLPVYPVNLDFVMGEEKLNKGIINNVFD